jgi:hypothetical protein
LKIKGLQPEQSQVFFVVCKARTTSKARNSFDILKKEPKSIRQQFYRILFEKLGKEAALKVMSLYHIGTSKHCKVQLYLANRYFRKSKGRKNNVYDRETGTV